MSKAFLSFNLDDYDDKMAHFAAIKAKDMTLVLWSFDQYLRNKIKYNCTDEVGQLTEDQIESLQAARDELRNIMGEHGVHFEELTY